MVSGMYVCVCVCVCMCVCVCVCVCVCGDVHKYGGVHIYPCEWEPFNQLRLYFLVCPDSVPPRDQALLSSSNTGGGFVTKRPTTREFLTYEQRKEEAQKGGGVVTYVWVWSTYFYMYIRTASCTYC